MHKVGTTNLYTLDKIIYLLKKQNKSQRLLCNHLGLHQQAFTNWKNGASTSYKKYLPEIAEYLNVPIDYLLENPKTKNSSEEEDKLLEIFNSLNDKQKAALLAFLDSLKD